jgi:hypothetical protein
VANGIAFSGISGKQDRLARYSKIFGKFLTGISVPFEFLPRKLRYAMYLTILRIWVFLN